MTIGYDHRVIDGAIADEFMQVVKKMIENWDAASRLAHISALRFAGTENTALPAACPVRR